MSSPSSALVPWLRASGFLLLAMSTPAVLAQGGFGPDPYRPFNSQYDSFVYPIAPGSGDVVPNEAAMSRAGLARGNQFQNYLQGNVLGSTGYRTQRRLDPRASREQQYQPNRSVDEKSGFYEKQEAVSEAYFAYLREKDPKKRAELLKKYQREKSRPARDFAPDSQRRKAQQDEDAGGAGAAGMASRTRKPSAPPLRNAADKEAGAGRRPSSGSRNGASRSGAGRESASARPGGSSDTSKPSESTPSEVLEESLRRDQETKSSTSGPGAPPPIRRTSPGRIPPAPPRRAGASSTVSPK